MVPRQEQLLVACTAVENCQRADVHTFAPRPCTHAPRRPVTIGPSAVDVVVRYWHIVGGESLVARRRGSGVRLPLGLVVARQSQALCRTYN